MSTDCITDCVRLVKSDPRAGRPCSSADCISAPPQQLACQWRDVTTADRPTPYASTLESEPIARVAGAGLPSRPALLPKVRSRASRLAPLAAPARRRTDCPERLLPEHGGRSHWPQARCPRRGPISRLTRPTQRQGLSPDDGHALIALPLKSLGRTSCAGNGPSLCSERAKWIRGQFPPDYREGSRRVAGWVRSKTNPLWRGGFRRLEARLPSLARAATLDRPVGQ